MFDEVVSAYHEAGHVLLAEHVGARVLFVTIDPIDDDGPRRHGETRVAWATNAWRANCARSAVSRAKVALAGPAAEMIYRDEHYAPQLIQEWWADWLMAAASLRSWKATLTDRAVLHQISALMAELLDWFRLDHVWARLALLADQLEAHETLESDQLDALRAVGLL